MDAFRRGYIQLFDQAFVQLTRIDSRQQGDINTWFDRYGDIAGALAGRSTPVYSFSGTDPEGNRRTAAALYNYGFTGYLRIKEAFPGLR